MHALNKIYRTIWSEALNAWVAVSELVKSNGKGSCSCLMRVLNIGGVDAATDDIHRHRFKFATLTALCLFSFGSQANPIGGNVVNGSASFNTSGNTLTVTNTPGAIINWQDFSIQQNEITRFNQQSASSAVLNRVVGGNTSQILGSLQSNGRVFLVNPNGVVFGSGSTVDVAGLVATSLNLSDADFLAGRHRFTNDPNAQAVSNAGNITAQQGGEIWLIAPNVDNSGVVTAPNGEILLAAGSSVELVNSLDPNLRVNITAPAGDATNVGQLVASAGRLGLFGAVVKNAGQVSADSATMQGGKIVFRSSQRTEITGTASVQGVGGGEIKVLSDMQTGTVSVSGALDASAPVSGDGGFIDTSAAHLDIAPTVSITANAANGKAGEWLIDPFDITIGNTQGTMPLVSSSPPGSGNFTAALNSSFISSGTINAALDLGTSVTVSTGATTTGSQLGNITVASAITKTTGTVATLSLNANNNINLNANITDISGSGLNLVLNHGVAGSVALTSGLSLAGGSLDLQSAGITGTGTLNVTTGAATLIDVAIAGGTVAVSGGTLKVSGAWNNAGTLSVSGTGGLNLGGSFTTANLGTFSRAGGTVSVTGAWNNALQTYDLDGAGSMGSMVLSQGTITGGTINASLGSSITVNDTSGISPSISTLDGVTLGANTLVQDLTGGVSMAMTTLRILNGLTLNNSTLSLDGGASTHYSILSFEGGTPQTLSGTGTVSFTGTVASQITQSGAGTSLVIGPGVTVNGTMSGAVGTAGFDLTNQGTIDANTATKTIIVAGNNVTNSGTMSASVGGFNFASTTTFINDGTLSHGPGSSEVITVNPTNFTNNGMINTSSTAGMFNGGHAFIINPTNLTNNGAINNNAVNWYSSLDVTPVNLINSATGTIGNYSTGNVTINPSTSYSNAGLLEVAAGTMGFYKPSAANAGAFNISGGSLELRGSMTTAGLGTFNRTGGSVNIAGSLNNAANTLDIGGTGVFGTGGLTSLGINAVTGTIVGGTIVSGDATPLYTYSSAGILNGVTLGDATHTSLTTTSAASGTNINNGLTLADGFTLNLGAGASWSFNGVSTINSLGISTINLGGMSLTANTATTGFLTIGSGVTVAGSGTLTSAANATIINNGVLDGNFGTVTISPTTFTNNGIVKASVGTISATGTNFTQNGTIEVVSGALFQRTVGLTNAGTLSGTGTFNFNTATLTNNGVIAPGLVGGATGTLSITGNLVMGATGSLNADINGAGLSDVLNVSGTATLAGTLNLDGLGGAGSYVVFNSTGATTGTFTTINSGLFTQTPTYTANSLTIAVTANAIGSYIYWDGGAGTSNWGDALNWSTDVVPLATDSIYIGSVAGAPVQFYATNIKATDFVMNGSSLTVFGDLNIDSLGSISLTDAAISGPSIYSSLNITFRANNDILLNNSALNASYGKATLNSNFSGNGGAIALTNSSITSYSGIALGGGMAGTGIGAAQGTAAHVEGVRIDGSVLTNAGIATDIKINGRGFDGVSNANGVNVMFGSQVVNNSGAVSINGIGGAGNSFNTGVTIDAAITASSNVNILGYGGLGNGSSNMGVFLSGGASVYATTGSVAVEGVGSSTGMASSTNHGIRLNSGSSIGSNNGNIDLFGIGAWGGDGVQIFSKGNGITTFDGVSSTSGKINIVGSSGDAQSAANGIYMLAGSINTGGNINLVGTSVSGGTVGGNVGVGIDVGSTLSTTAGTGNISIVGQGGNRGDGFQLIGGSTITTGSGNIIIDANSGTQDALAFQSMRGAWIGGTGTRLESTGSGNIVINGTSHALYATNNYGLSIDTAAVVQNVNGNIALFGTGGNSSDFNDGISIINATVTTTGAGSIVMEGVSGNALGVSNRGINIQQGIVSATGAGNVALTGLSNATLNSSAGRGVEIQQAGLVKTTTGALSIVGGCTYGNANCASNLAVDNIGIYIHDSAAPGAGGGRVLSTSGAISLTGSTWGSGVYGIQISDENSVPPTPAAVDTTLSGTSVISLDAANGDLLIDLNTKVASNSSGNLSLSAAGNVVINTGLNLAGAVKLRVDGNGDGVGALSFGVGGGISGGTLDYYYNPTVFGTLDGLVGNNGTLAVVNEWMLVNDAINLQAINTSAATLGGHYALGRNLDMTGVVGYVPIGNATTAFTGQFDGMGLTISNLTVSSNLAGVGLFGEIGALGSVKSLGLTNVAIHGTAATSAVGGLAGVNRGTIFASYVDGGTVIANNGAAGGLVGHNLGGDGTAAVTTTPGAAGSTALISDSYVANVAVSVMASGAKAAGGLVGINSGGLGGLGGNSVSLPGAVGGAGGSASISNSYVTGGTVSGMGASPNTGGLVGLNQGGNGGNGGTGIVTAGGAGGAGGVASIGNSYASSGAVIGTTGSVGGLIGTNASGVAGAAGVGGLPPAAAGAAGIASATTVAWDSTSSGQGVAIGGGNLDVVVNVSAAPYAQASYTGFDFVNTWWMAEGSTRPFLISEWSPVITNAHQLQLMGSKPAGNYALAQNIDLTSALTVSAGSMWGAQGFGSIGTSLNPFLGGLAGNGNTITGLKIAQPAVTDVGLFGVLGAGARVSNLSFASANVSGAIDVGVLAGKSTGAVINNVAVTNAQVLATTSQAGGLIGRNEKSALINVAVSGGTIQATGLTANAVGGLAGSSYGSYISNGQVSGAYVAGHSSVGGVVGLTGSTLGSGLIVNNIVSGSIVGISYTTTTLGGLIGSNAAGNVIYGNYVLGNSTINGNWGVGGLVGSNNGLATRNTVAATSLSSLAIGNNGPLFGTDVNSSFSATLHNHYDIDTVQLNLAPVSATGGLYATQYADWIANGWLNIGNYSASLLPISAGNVQIGTVQGMKDLLGFAQDPRYAYTLNANIDMSPIITPSLNNYLIPEFWGKFDGGGFTISNLTINQTNLVSAGLFGEIREAASVRNLVLGNASVSVGGGNKVGLLTGWNLGEIFNVSAPTGSVFGSSSVGGLIGYNDGYVAASHVGSATGASVSGGATVGGLIGLNAGRVDTSYVTGGSVSGSSFVGGLVGLNLGTINQSYVASGSISASSLGVDVGGLVGRNELAGVVQTSHVTNLSVIGGTNVGGLVGNNLSSTSGASGMLDGSFADTVAVTGTNYIGGIVGLNSYCWGDCFTSYGVTNNYAINGAVTSSGIFAGLISGNGLQPLPTNNHYNIDTMTIKVGAMAAPANMVQRGGLYTTQFIDWLGSGDMATGGLVLDIANYSGVGQSLELIGGNYTISNEQGMQDLLGFVDDSTYTFVLNANIDVSMLPNYSIPLLRASLDGQGNTISGLNINLSGIDGVGFVQSNEGTLSNIGLVAPIVVGHNNVGGLVAWNEGSPAFSSQNLGAGTIAGSFVNGGSVSGFAGAIGGLVAVNNGVVGQSYVANATVASSAAALGTNTLELGGLAGSNAGSISNSFVTGGSVMAALTDGSAAVGGLVGSNSSSLSNTFVSGGTVNGGGAWDVGGLAGRNNALSTVSTSYAANTVLGVWGAGGLIGADSGSVSNSFWDTQTSGLAAYSNSGIGNPLNVTGLTTAQTMLATNTELALGLTTGSIATTGGTTGLAWRIYEGQSTPMLMSFLQPLNVSVAGNQIYNGTTDVSGLVTYSVTPDANLLGTAVANSASANVGTYSGVTPSGLYSTPMGYDISYVPGTVSITPAGIQLLTVTANNANKTYGTTLTFAGTEFTPVGLYGGDVISSVILTSSGAVNTANAGSYAINITPGSEVFGSGSASNYNITYGSGTLTVNPAPLTVTANAGQSKIYGNADQTFTYTSSGLLFSDVLTGSLGRATGENVGTYAINQGTLANSNYAITYTGDLLAITPRSITVAANAVSKVYGGADNLTYTVGGSGLAAWDTQGTAFTGALTRTVGENVAGSPYTVSQGTLGLANANYTLAGFTPGSLTITPATLTVTAANFSKIYDGLPYSGGNGVTYAGFQFTDTSAVVTGAVAYGGSSQGAINVGGYSITPTGLSAANYTMNYVGGMLTVSPASLSISANTLSKVYGNVDPTLTYAVTGLLGSDVLSGSLVRATGENVGGYAISQGTLSNTNYTVSYTPATFSITQRAISIAANNVTKTYGSADSMTFTVGGAGLASWDSQGSVFSGSLTRAAGENVVGSPYAISQGTLAPNANYSVSGFTGASMTITPAALSVTANSINKVLGTPDPALTYSVSGLQFSDTAATVLNGALDREPGDLIGRYQILQGTVVLNSSNYTMTFTPGMFGILAPTVVQEITQASVGSGTPESKTTEEEKKKEEEQVLAEADIGNDQGSGLPDNLPVCR